MRPHRRNPEYDFPTYQRVIKRALRLIPTELPESVQGRVDFAIRETVAAAKIARTLANEPGATTDSAARKLITLIAANAAKRSNPLRHPAHPAHRRNPSKTTPRIYVANLAAYNAGRMKGEWIEPSSDEGELAQQVIAAIGSADDEYAIHDYDGFPDMGENPDLDEVAAMAGLLEEYPYAIVRAAMDFVSPVNADTIRDFLDEGYGVYESKRDYVEQYIDDAGGVVNAVPKDQINFYFDYDAFGHDVSIDADEEDRERYEGMSDREIGESVIDDLYGDKIPKNLVEGYFDYDAYARDVFMEVASKRVDGLGLVVFNAR